jgi:hypothetical protein
MVGLYKYAAKGRRICIVSPYYLTLNQLPIVAVVSFVIVNGAALLGLRLKEKRLK